MSAKKPWPRNVVVICCSRVGQADTSQQDCPVLVRCHDCGQALWADATSIGNAAALPVRRGRPLDFLCLDCRNGYDMQRVEVYDHSAGKQFSQRN